MADVPSILVTMGDVAGIGPEIIARAWPTLFKIANCTVVGSPAWLERAIRLVGSRTTVRPVARPGDQCDSSDVIPCIATPTADLSEVAPGHVSAAAGRAAYDFLTDAIRRTMSGEASAIVTCPLHKEGLHAAGIPYPGHTEILAAQSGVRRHAMLLSGDGITVAHVTLHMALRDAVARISTQGVLDAIELLTGIVPKLVGHPPHIAVAGLNPHASDGGLFGDEEARIIAPAVERARAAGHDVAGPLPADALWVRAAAGQFDAVVAMYHDQGHVAMKMRSGLRAVNITAGLPFVRTSVAHGTAYDIAGQGIADATSLIEACRVAVRLVE